MNRLARWPLIFGIILFAHAAAYTTSSVFWLNTATSRSLAAFGALLLVIAILDDRHLYRFRLFAATYILVYSIGRAFGVYSVGSLGTVWLAAGVSLAFWVGMAWTE